MEIYSTFYGEGTYADRLARTFKLEGKWYIELNGGNLEDGKFFNIISEEEGENIAEDFCLGFRDN